MRGQRLVVLGGVVAVAWLSFEAVLRLVPLPAALESPPPSTSEIRDRHGKLLVVVPTDTAREAVPKRLDQLGRWLPDVTVAIEDRRFHSHRGVDWLASGGALVRNVQNFRVLSGASTITQQLIKISSPPGPRTWSAKAREALLAMALERRWSKDQILEAYLNRIDYGNRRIGAEAAARAYFGKPAHDLTLAESIFLAGLPQSPSRLNPWKSPAAAHARYERNVRRLASAGLLPPESRESDLLATLPTVSRNDPPQDSGDLLTAMKKLALDRGNLTLDVDLQQTVTVLAENHLREMRSAGLHDLAVVVVENRSGEVGALVSAVDARHAGIVAALEPRSCGSTLKPFLYAKAIDARAFTAASLLPDTADAITDVYRDYDPQNFSGRFRGPVRLRDALGNSLNVPAVVVLGRLGARQTFASFRNWALDFADDFGESGAGFILGNARVSPLSLAAAYATLARGGLAAPARLSQSQVAATRKAASAEACAIVTDILCDPAARRDSFGDALSMPQRTAVKTGTSSGFRDGWCAGFTGDHTVVVWAGNLDGRPLADILAVRSAAPLWKAVVAHLYATGDQPVPAPPATLTTLRVATETGLLPRPDEPAVSEWFLPGTEPTVRAESAYRDGVLELPGEYTAWCTSNQNHLGARIRESSLRILHPRDGATFLLEDSIRPDQQAIPLRASTPDCEWFLNETPLATPLVPLRKGRWQLTARSGSESASLHFIVE
ncbi:MAG: transglycosylase domain-containing protein [Terrimicrobiaceae bacterium]|nr:transglycosylase domain-containing protein [Terrimicrobiaceae bacterium]